MIEPDFSLWADRPLAEQLWSTYRMRTLGRLYQDHGLMVIPNLTWSDARSFAFCFSGILQHAPVVATECRTPGGHDEDRRAFLAGLTEGVKQVQPQHVIIHGGDTHRYWLHGNLPEGPNSSTSGRAGGLFMNRPRRSKSYLERFAFEHGLLSWERDRLGRFFCGRGDRSPGTHATENRSSTSLTTLSPHAHLTPQEIAVYLRVTGRTVYRLCEERELPFLRWGHVIRIPRDKLLLWYKQHGKGFIG